MAFETAVVRSVAPRFPNRDRHARMWHRMALDLNMLQHFPEFVSDADINATIEHSWRLHGYDESDLTS